jgi:NAD(P)H dehydrogenase (quinone)
MTTLVVQAHPVPDSFNAALLEQVVGGLEETSGEFRVMRLAQGDRPVVGDVSIVEQLVLVYPTWSGGQPAMLLDWIQDMLLDGSAFAKVQRLIAVTSLGSTQFLNRIQGEWGRAHLSGLVLDACADGASFEWLPLYKIDRQPQEAIDAYLEKVRQRFAQASEVESLP